MATTCEIEHRETYRDLEGSQMLNDTYCKWQCRCAAVQKYRKLSKRTTDI